MTRSGDGRSYLHEPAQPNDDVVKARILEVLLCTVLDLHKGNFRVLVAVVDGVEHELLDSHGFGTLYERNFPFPVYLKQIKEVLLRPKTIMAKDWREW